MAGLTYPRLEYADAGDFFALRARAVAEIRSIHPEWSDDQVANYGNVLLELACAVGDTLKYYQDNQANETRITTARRMSSMRAHAKLSGYRIRGQTAARAGLTYAIDKPTTGHVTIPQYTTVSTEEVTDPIAYQTQSDTVIMPGQTVAYGVAEHSAAHEYAVHSTGLPDIVVVLPTRPFIDGTLAVHAANGDYAEVPSFYGSGAQDLHYVRDIDAQDRAVVRFGTGAVGAVPGGLVTFEWKTGGGRAGRVDAGKLTRIPGVWKDSLGNVVRLTVTNPERSTPAEDREGIESIRMRAPQVVRTQTRAVSREDFEISAEQVPGVVRALYVTNNEIVGIEENTGILYVVPSGLGEAPDELLDEVRARFAEGGETPKHTTHRLDVRGALYLPVTGVARVILSRASKATPAAKAAVGAAARAAWVGFFAPEIQTATDEWVPNPSVDFGLYYANSDGTPTGYLAWSDPLEAILGVPGITKVDAGGLGFTLNGVRADVPIHPVHFPVDGGFTLIDVETGEQL